MQWTADQQKVIDKRDDNILVSASAGSGKTAVLVARILAYITDPEEPVDIDRLLIVTFTKAAAGEMKERIGKAIADALEKSPDNEHLQRQSSLIHNAHITTIDGFCSYVVRAFCHTTDLEPGFRVADEGEVKLLRADVMREILEELHGREDGEVRQRFEDFVESFATGKTDKAVEDAILKLFDAAESQPWPAIWLTECRANNAAESYEQMSGTAWMQAYMRDADLLIQDGLARSENNMQLCERPDGPSAYLPVAEDDLRFFTELSSLADYAERVAYVRAEALKKPPRLSTKKPGPGEDPDIREVFKSNRAESKAIRDELTGKIYAYSPDEVLAAMQANAPILNTLIDVVQIFSERFAEKKRDRRVVDFADLEHFALQILRDEDGSRKGPAKELAGRFREVMCDEYQDSNYLQEAILTAVSRIEDGQNNYFCVGDVKQSIYGFRHARPDLFMKKYHDYRKIGRGGTRIDLCQNFRSRHEVLDTANALFAQLMIPGVGGVAYDEEAALVCGATYPKATDGAFDTELLITTAHEEDTEGNALLADESASSAKELEVRMIAERISHLVGHEKIFDQKTGLMREVEYRDIVILLRTMSGWADTFANILGQQGIPAYSTAKSGYFSATEVTVILDYLAILDNPQQDIPYAAVLRSPIVGLSAEELAKVRCAYGTPSSGNRNARYKSLAECAARYASGEAENTDHALRQKLIEFLDYYNTMRDSVPYTPIHELIWDILTKTGYLDYASALPGGAQRAANLRMLTEKAIAYEETSYVGLFNFIRYINNLKKVDADEGEVSVLAENENVVRIVSIHKSKGLEYPVVFVAGCSKTFNRSDINASLLIDQEYGIASDYVDFRRRVRIPTVKKAAVRRKLLRENMGEEMRILYVALTRAKQKLILTGLVKDEEAYENLRQMPLPLREIAFPENYLLNSRSPIIFLIPAIDRMIARAEADGRPCSVTVSFVKPSGLAVEEIKGLSRFGETLRMLRGMDGRTVYDAEVRKIIEEHFSYVYPFEGRGAVPAKVSVSQLKHGQYTDEEAEEKFPEPPIVPYVPEFMRKAMREVSDAGKDAVREDKNTALRAETVSATTRGTAYHRIMELLDYGRIAAVRQDADEAGSDEVASGKVDSDKEKSNEADSDKENSDKGKSALPNDFGYGKTDALIRELKAQTEGFVRTGRILSEEADSVDMRDIAAFVESSLGERMAAAFAEKKLYREQPFTLGVPASEINPNYPEDEPILVQGIIDAFFYEGDSIVLVDYKTDRVEHLEELKKRYQIQLDSYEEALSRVTGYPVAQKIIWSFAKGCELVL
ncbi:MAG: helicase-exonuclease AddAB subunit AddA [Lachnospiraceae bacterium]|nr:helicase-exonuclease AddAB subunit AddA [Lachnospiraceae bacterium]